MNLSKCSGSKLDGMVSIAPFEIAEADVLTEALLIEAAVDAGAHVIKNGGVHLLNATSPLTTAAHVAILG